jgi:hypothetical protein
MANLFISYRRDDAADPARALFEHLQARCKRNSIFLDLDRIEIGEDFREVIGEEIKHCQVLLALIGPQWTTITDKNSGQRRLDNPDDLVRREIAMALDQRKLVVPVILAGATMPGVDELPEDIRALRDRNACRLDARRWTADINELVRQLPKRLGCGTAIDPRSSFKDWLYALLLPIMLLVATNILMVFKVRIDPLLVLTLLSILLGGAATFQFKFSMQGNVALGVLIASASVTLMSILVPLIAHEPILPISWPALKLIATFAAAILMGYLIGTVIVNVVLWRGPAPGR